MRILYLITRSEHGGAQSHLLHLLRGLTPADECLVATGEDGFLCGEVRRCGIAVKILKHLKHAPHPWHDAAGFVEMKELIQSYRPDIVHSHSGKAGLLGRLAAAYCGVHSVYTAHGFSFGKDVPFARKAIAIPGECIGAMAGDLTIAVSRSECSLAMRKRIGFHSKITVIYNGVDPSGIRATTETNPPIIAMVARFARPKQQRLLLRAFRRTSQDAKLWFIGDGPELAAVQREAAEAGMSGRVTFWGDRDDAAELMSQVQIAALISSNEGFGLSLIEAMSIGLPVVASSAGGMREIVNHGETGLLVRPEDEIGLAAALDLLIANPQLRRRMGTAGLERYRRKFTAEHMVAKTFAAYRAILDCPEDRNRLQCPVFGCSGVCQQKFALSGD